MLSLSASINGNSISFTSNQLDNLYLKIGHGGYLSYSSGGAYVSTNFQVNGKSILNSQTGGEMYLAGMDMGGGTFSNQGLPGLSQPGVFTGIIDIIGNLTTGGQNLTLNGQSILIDPRSNGASGITVDASSASGNAGKITFNAQSISIGSYDRLLAMAPVGFSAGEITLNAVHTVTNLKIAIGNVVETVALTLLNGGTPLTAAIVTLGEGASLNGGTVSVTSTAGDVTPYANEGPLQPASPYIQGLGLGPITSWFNDLVDLPISVVVKESTAKVEIGANASISGTGSVTLSTSASSDATGEAIFYGKNFGIGGGAFAYTEADTTAVTQIDSGVTIYSGKDVTVASTGTTTSSATARVTQNTGTDQTNPNNIQASIAVAVLNTTSHATVAKGATLAAPHGNVTVQAFGKDKNATSVQTASYRDGLVGFTAGVGFTNCDVKAYVDGTIFAASRSTGSAVTFNPFISIDFSTSTIDFEADPGYATGEPLVYSSGLGGTVRGLVRGQTYYAIVNPINPTQVQLALTPQDAINGQPIVFGQYPMVNGIPFDNVDPTSGTIYLDFNPRFTEGEIVNYQPVPGNYLGYDDGNGNLLGELPAGQYAVHIVNSTVDSDNLYGFQLEDRSGKVINLDDAPIFTTATGKVIRVASFSSDGNTVTFVPSDLTGTTLINGDHLTYTSAIATNVIGLADGVTYYAIVNPNTDGTIQLAGNLQDSQAANPTLVLATPYFTWIDSNNNLHSTTIESIDASINPATGLPYNAIVFDSDPGIPNGTLFTYHAIPGVVVGGLTDGQRYITNNLDVSATGSTNFLMQLSDFVTHKLIQLSLTQTLQGNCQSFAISLADGYGHTLTISPQPNSAPGALVNGEAFTYFGTPGENLGSLIPGQTYYVIVVDQSNPNSIVIALDVSQIDAKSAKPNALDLDGAVDLGSVDLSYMSGTEHTLTPTQAAGISITSTVTSMDTSKVSSAIGSEPKIKDFLSNGQLAPASGNIVKNLLTGSNIKNVTNAKLIVNIIKTAGQADKEDNVANNNFSLSASVLGLLVINSSIAEVGNDALLMTQRDLIVNSTLDELTQTYDQATAAKPDEAKTTLVVAASFLVAGYNNSAHAFIDSNAQVDANGVFSVNSAINYPFVWQIYNPDGFQPDDFFGKYAVRNLDDIIDGKLGLQDQLVSSFATAGVKNPNTKVSLSGSLDVNVFSNDSEAQIFQGAQINQLADYQDPGQSITVTSSTTSDQIDFAGNVYIDVTPDNGIKSIRGDKVLQSVPFTKGTKLTPGIIYQKFLVPTQSATAGFGGSAALTFMSNTTTAIIGGADPNNTTSFKATRINYGNGGLLVKASQEIFHLGLGQSGGDSKNFAFNGSFTFDQVITTTLSQIRSGAIITSDIGTTGNLNINTSDDATLVGIAGAVLASENSGIGLVGVVDNFTRSTEAILGDQTGSSPPGSSTIHVGGNVNVNATMKGTIVNLALAAALLSKSEPAAPAAPAPGTDTKATENATSLNGAASPVKEITNVGALGGDSETQGSYGIGISGDAAVSILIDTTLAYINDKGTIQGANFEVASRDLTVVVTAAGSATYTSGGGSAGLAGSFGVIFLGGSDNAFITSAIIQANQLTVSANRVNVLFTLTAGGAGGPENPTVAVAGSVSINVITNTTEAYLNSVNVTLIGESSVTAEDDSVVIGVAGALEAGVGGKFGVGTGVAVNVIDNQTEATVTRSTLVQSLGDLILAATNVEVTLAIAGAGAVTTGQVALAGAFSVNLILTTAQAFLSSSSYSNSSSGNLALTTTDEPVIVSLTGQISLGKNIGIGAAVSYNQIDATNEAYLDNTKIQMQGALNLTTLVGIPPGNVSGNPYTEQLDGVSHAIFSGALGGAGAKKLAAAGSVTLNLIVDTDETTIQNHSSVTAGTLALSCTDSSDIYSGAGAVAISNNVGIGAATAANIITDNLSTLINNSIVSATSSRVGGPGVQLTATSAATILTVTIAGAGVDANSEGGSVAVAGAGAASANTIVDSVEALIENGSHVTSGEGVDLAAADNSQITAAAGAGSLAILGEETEVGVTIGGAVALNGIGDTVIASIQGGTVNASGNIILSASGAEHLSALTVGLAGSISTGDSGAIALAGAGSASGNVVVDTVNATITGLSTVISSNGGVSLTATAGAMIIAAAGAAAIAVGGDEGKSVAASVGISLAANTITNNVLATINSSNVEGSRDVALDAESTANIVALTVAGAAAGGIGEEGAVSVGGAGAASLNNIINIVSASVLTGSTVSSENGSITVSAIDDSMIDAAAGAVALTLSGGSGLDVAVSIGASAADSDITNTVTAAIDDSTVSGGAGLHLTAKENASIESLTQAAAGAVSAGEGGGLAGSGAGAASANTIQTTVGATISGNSTVTTGSNGTVVLDAEGNSLITAQAVGVAITVAAGATVGAGGAGAALATNVIINNVTANIDHSTVTSGSDISLSALEATTIIVLTVGLAGALAGGESGAVSLAGAGSASGNDVTNTLKSSVTHGSSVTSTKGKLALTATSTGSKIIGLAGSGSLSVAVGSTVGVGLAAGVSIAINIIENTIEAQIDSSIVSTYGDISLNAQSGATIQVLTVAGSVATGVGEATAIAFAGAGAGSGNTITNTVNSLISNTNHITSSHGAVNLTTQDSSTINAAAGSVSVAVAGGAIAAAASVGASIAVNTIINTVEATITNAKVQAGNDVLLSATESANIVAVTAAAAGSGGVGEEGGLGVAGAGAISVNTITNTIEALVTNSTVINKNTTLGVTLHAGDESIINADGGGASIAGAIGQTAGIAITVGAAFAVNQITNTIKASVDNSTVNSGGSIALSATSGAKIFVITVGLAGSIAGGEGAGISLAGAGSGSGNAVTNTIEASVKDMSSVTSTSGGVFLTALTTDASEIIANAGAAALAGAIGQGGGVALAVGVSVAVNLITNSILSQIDRSTVSAAGNLSLDSESTALIDVVTAAGSVAAGGGQVIGGAFAGAGAASGNTITNTVTATISNTNSVIAVGGVNLTAHDDSSITAAAGSLALAVAIAIDGVAAGLSVGAGIAVNTINNSVEATITNATIKAGGGVTLDAQEQTSIRAVTVASAGSIAGGGAGGGLAVSGAGAGSINTVSNTVEALITASTVANMSMSKGVILAATDDSSITADAGGASVSGSFSTIGIAVSVGAAFGSNNITNIVKASVDGSALSSGGDVLLSALETAKIFVITVGAAGSLGGGEAGGIAMAGAGSGSGNSITNTVESSIKNKSGVTSSAGDVVLNGQDTSSINASAGAAALAIGAAGAAAGGVAVSVSTASNAITNTINAWIDNSAVSAAKDITVNANSTANIFVLTVAGSAAGAIAAFAGIAFAGAGAGSGNTITNTIEAVISNTNRVTAGGAITASAKDGSRIDAAAGAVALAVGGAVTGVAVAGSAGASVAINTINNTVEALITSATVQAGGGATLTASDNASILAVTSVAAGSLGIGIIGGLAFAGAGAGSNNTISNTVEALLSANSKLMNNSTSNGVVISATDDSNITADSGGATVAGSYGVVSGAASFAAAFAYNDITNTVLASVDGSVVTSRGNVALSATEAAKIFVITVGAAGSLGVADVISISIAGAGSFSINNITNTVEASIKDGSNVTSYAGQVMLSAQNSGHINASAGSGALAIALGGGGGLGLAAGVSAAVNQINNSNKAWIDSSSVAGSSGVSLNAQSTAKIQVLTVAGAGAGAGGAIGGIAFAGAGAASNNRISDTTEALISNTNTVSSSTGLVSLQAQDSSTIQAAAGAVALAIAGGAIFGIAASVGAGLAINSISNTVEATITNAMVTAGGGISLNALASSTILAVTTAAAGTVAGGAGGGLAVSAAGAGSSNTIADTVEAMISASTVINTRASQGVTCAAADNSSITADAGGASIAGAGGGGAGAAVAVGAAFATNAITNTILAFIDNSTVKSGGDISLSATSGANIFVVTVGFAGALGIAGGGGISLSGAGSGSGNTVNNTIEASITNGSNVTSTVGTVALTALDSSRVDAAAGALSLGGAGGGGIALNLGLGVSAAANDIGNTIEAWIDHSAVSGAAGVSLNANSTAFIEVVTIAGSVAGGIGGNAVAFRGAGSGSSNTINDTIKSIISNTENVRSTNGTVSLQAQDASTVEVSAGTVSVTVVGAVGLGLGGSVGASIAENSISNTIEAAITNATVSAGAGVQVNAYSTSTILAVTSAAAQALSGGLIGGLAGSGAGASSTNSIHNTIEALISSSTVTNTGTSQPVSLQAEDNSKITADGGGVSFSGSIGVLSGAISFGAALAANKIGNTVEASLENSMAASSGGVNLSGTSGSEIYALTLGIAGSLAGGLAGGVALAGTGSGSGNAVNNTIEAFASGSQVTATGGSAVYLQTTDNSTIKAVAGSGSFSVAIGGVVSAAAAVGTSVAVNTIGNTIQAYLQNTTVTAGSFSEAATSSANIDAFTVGGVAAIGGGIGLTGAFAGAGAGSGNTISDDIESYVYGSTVTAVGAFTQAATDNATINASSGAVSVSVAGSVIGSATVSIGLSLVTNNIGDTVKADVNGSTITAGSVALTATSISTINAISQGSSASSANSGGIAAALAGVGATATNKIHNYIEAFVQNSSQIIASGLVNLTALDQSAIKAQGAGGSFAESTGGLSGSIAIGVVLANNTVVNTVRAFIGSMGTDTTSVISSTGAVKLAATSNSTIAVAGIAAAVSGSFDGFSLSGAGCSATNTTNNSIGAFIQGGIMISANGPVILTAMDEAGIDTEVGTSALSFGLIGASIGDSSSTNLIDDSVKAFIGNATVTSISGGITVTGISNDRINSKTIATGISISLGASIGGGDSNSTYSGQVLAYIGGQARVTANKGPVVVAAASTDTINAEADGGTASLVAVGSMTATTNLGGLTSAYLIGSPTIQSQNLDLTATGNFSSSAIENLLSAGGFAGAEGIVSANVTPEVTAYVGSSANVALTGALQIEATSNTAANANAQGFAGGAVSFDDLVSKATVAGSTLAYIGQGATIQAASLSVRAQATISNATANSSILGIGLGTDAGSNTTATVNEAVKAFVGSPDGTTASGAPTILDISGNITVQAENGDSASPAGTGSAANVNVTVGAGGFIAVGAAYSNAVVEGKTLAYIGDGAEVKHGTNLAVKATGIDQATDQATIGSGGAATARGTDTETHVSPTIIAYLGNNVIVNVSGTVTVDSTSIHAEGHSTAESLGGGGIDVGLPNANTNTRPTVEAFIGRGSQINAGSNVTVHAAALSTATQAFNDQIQGVNPATDSITFPSHGLVDGDFVVYVPNGSKTPLQTPNGPLDSIRTYRVIVVDPNTLLLGASFSAGQVNASNALSQLSGVDPTRNVISFTGADDFKTGDSVHYDANGNLSISNQLNASGTYYVRVINANTIKLYSTLAEATAPYGSFTASSQVSNNTIEMANNFEDGVAVTYQAPAATIFHSSQINNNSIPVSSSSDYRTGDAVVYQTNATNGVTPLNGLVNGQTYYVIHTRNSGSIQLAATFLDAFFGNAIDLNPDSKAANAIELLQQPSINGLTNGFTYFVTNATANSFQLTATPGGNFIPISAEGTSGIQEIGLDGIALQPSSGTQNIHLVLSGPASASQSGDKLLAADGESLRTISPPSGSGQSSATAHGGSGGGIEISEPTATTTVDPTCKAFVEARLIRADGDVAITSVSFGNIAAYGSNSGGGIIDVGKSSATTTFGQNQDSNNLEAIPNTSEAFVGIQNPISGSVDGIGVQILAEGNFTLSSLTQLTTNVNASADGAGFISVSEGDATANIVSNTNAVVGDNATITARSDSITADGSQFNLAASSEASAYGIGGDATANSNSYASSKANVLIGGGSTITGYEGVDVQALNQQFSPQLYSSATGSVFFIPVTGSENTNNNNHFQTTVQANPGGNLNAGPRPGSSDSQLLQVPGYSFLALDVQAADNNVNNASENRIVTWNANVQLLSGQDPTLIVDANGKIIKAVNVTVNDNGVTKGEGDSISGDDPTVVVNDITIMAGQAIFEGFNGVYDSSNSPPYPGGSPYPLFTIVDTVHQATILNYSAKNLLINNIAVANPSTQATVQIDSAGVDSNTLPFDFRITHTEEPTLIDIENLNPHQRQTTIKLAGQIDNPIGQTIIKNQRGDIASISTRQVVRTNILDIEATANIGLETNRVNVEIVQSTDISTNTQRLTNLTAVSTGGSVNLNLTGRLRAGGGNPFIVYIDSIIASQDINLLLKPSLQDPGAGIPQYALEVVVEDLNNTNLTKGNYLSFFHPDQVPSPTPALDPGLFANLERSTTIASTYDFRHYGSDEKPTGATGLTAGGNIIVQAANSKSTDPRIDIIGSTNLTGIGHINLTTNGNITFNEGSQGGTMRVGTIQSNNGYVLLTVPDLASSGQNLELINNGLISASGTVVLLVGDNVTTGTGSILTAGKSITAIGNYFEGMDPNPGVGSSITINGYVSSPLTTIDGNTNNDTINLNFTHGINTQATSVAASFINAMVVVDGKAGSNGLKVSDASDLFQDQGYLTNNTVMGLGMGGVGVQYTNIQNLEVDLSQGGTPYFNIYSTHVNTTTLVRGGAGNDSINVGAPLTALAGLTTPPVVADRGDLNAMRGLLNLIGNGGVDNLVVNDHGDSDGPPATGSNYPPRGYNYIVRPTSVLNDPSTVATVPNPTTPPARTFAGMIYNSSGDPTKDTLKFLRLDGTDDANIFTVTPSQITTYTINGNLPASGLPLPAGTGDYLQLNTTHFTTSSLPANTPSMVIGTGNRTLHVTKVGNGYWSFPNATTANGLPPYAQPIYFTSIEQFNHVAVTATAASAPGGTVVTVKDAETGTIEYYETPFLGYTGPVSLAIGDLNFDGIPDLVVAPGINPSLSPLQAQSHGISATIKIYNGSPNQFGKYGNSDGRGNFIEPLITSFMPFNGSDRTGVSLAVGNITGINGVNDIVVGSGPGYSPLIEKFNGLTLTTTHSQLTTPFYAFNNTAFLGGVNVAVGDLRHIGYDDVVATRASNGGNPYLLVSPTVNIFTYQGQLLNTFNSFSTSFHSGLTVAVGDYNGDGWNDIILGTGPGGMPVAVAYDGKTLFSANQPIILAQFTPGYANFAGGVQVTATPVNGGNPEVIQRIFITAYLVGINPAYYYYSSIINDWLPNKKH